MVGSFSMFVVRSPLFVERCGSLLVVLRCLLFVVVVCVLFGVRCCALLFVVVRCSFAVVLGYCLLCVGC